MVKFIIEVYNNLASNSASITEIKLFDKNSNDIPYSINYAYDSKRLGLPAYWNDSVWNKTNLYNNNITYLDNGTGATSSALFLYESTINSKNFSRFMIETNDAEVIISKIRIYAGSPESRIPEKINIYQLVGEFSNDLINTRDTNVDKLKLLSELNFTTSNITVIPYDINGSFYDIKSKFLLQSENLYYYLENKILNVTSEYSNELLITKGNDKLENLDSKISSTNYVNTNTTEIFSLKTIKKPISIKLT